MIWKLPVNFMTRRWPLWGSVNPLMIRRDAIFTVPPGVFGITNPINGEPATHGNGFTLGFAAESPEAVDAWHKAGVEAGGTDCEDPPGIREGAGMKMYIAYLRDPAGNKICALHRM